MKFPDAEQIQACDGSGKLVARSNGGNNIEELYGAGGWVASPAELLRFLAVMDEIPGIPDLLSDASDRLHDPGSSQCLPHRLDRDD